MKNKLYQQLDIFEASRLVVHQPKKMTLEVLKDKFRLVDNAKIKIRFTTSESLFQMMRKVAKIVGANQEITLQAYLEAAVVIGNLMPFCNGQKDIIDADWADENKLNQPSDGLIQLRKSSRDDREMFLVLTKETKRLNKMGQIWQFKRNFGDPNQRFTFIDGELLLGYWRVISDILHTYEQDTEHWSFNRDELISYLSDFLVARNRLRDRRYLFLKSSLGRMTLSEAQSRGYSERDWRVIKQHNALVDFLSQYFNRLANASLQAHYEDEISSITRARAWESKKHINIRTLKMVEDSSLNHLFAGIELDNEVSQKLFNQFEANVLQLMPRLPQGQNQPVLRLRKLGNYRAYGMYVRSNNNIVLDFRSDREIAAFAHAGVQSFIHEYGHYLDYQFSDEVLSLSDDFASILVDYKANLSKLPKTDAVAKKLNYYGTPTEVFARSFELYLAGMNFESTLIKDKDVYANDSEYRCFDAQLRVQISNYFDGLFPSLRNDLRSLQMTKIAADR